MVNLCYTLSMVEMPLQPSCELGPLPSMQSADLYFTIYSGDHPPDPLVPDLKRTVHEFFKTSLYIQLSQWVLKM